MQAATRERRCVPGRRWQPGTFALYGVLAGMLTTGLPCQAWQELQGRSDSGLVELHQAVLDARSDTLALLVASHPDDRYVLPAAMLRFGYGVRVAVLLATRGGGGQNSQGPETGDALRRIRTLESEACAAYFDAEVWYLNRPDRGYCRTAEEAFAEWGRHDTLRDLVRLIRRVRPDLVLTTHHQEESHGHDLALVDILPEAVLLAGDSSFEAGGEPAHRVPRLFLGSPSSVLPDVVRLPMETVDLLRGVTYRRFAYEALVRTHVSAGPLLPMETLFEPDLYLQPVPLRDEEPDRRLLAGLPSLFDSEVAARTSDPGALALLREDVEVGLARRLDDREALIRLAADVLGRLRAVTAPAGSDSALRLERRIEALERVLRHACGVYAEVEADPGAVAVPGEELPLDVGIHNGGPEAMPRVEIQGLAGADVQVEPLSEEDSLAVPSGGDIRLTAVFRVPLSWRERTDPWEALFQQDRFVPPVRVRFECVLAGQEVAIPLTVPVGVAPAVELTVIPRMLLLPSHRRSVQFTVEVQRNSNYPIDDFLEVRAPSGYVVEGNRKRVSLVEVRGETFDFELRVPKRDKPGVDLIRVYLGDQRVPLPLHRVEVEIDSDLRVGLVRGNDNTVLEVLGIGGFGLQWTELSDDDLAIRDLGEFDTIVVDIRALRNRTGARRSFRRLLEFSKREGRRLVVFYHKNTEFNPDGDGFRGAPYEPFIIGRGRVTRADAPVTALEPDHVLLNRPNVIRPSDWDDWEQERGLYFPGVYSDQYEELLEMHDPGMPPLRSALLYARHGKGEYVYCALSLYRQLKKLHPGGVRLLANLLTPSRR